jgi:hypothetical protein
MSCHHSRSSSRRVSFLHGQRRCGVCSLRNAETGRSRYANKCYYKYRSFSLSHDWPPIHELAPRRAGCGSIPNEAAFAMRRLTVHSAGCVVVQHNYIAVQERCLASVHNVNLKTVSSAAPEWHATYTTLQLWTQVAGRSGSALRKFSPSGEPNATALYPI